jgi:hypothetical protein
MPIGYANFSTIQQGNQQVVNQLSNLGQQIGQTIDNYAAMQSAQAMLPAIQQQYATGMQKISSGDSSGIANVTQAAGIAGQNPLTAHYSNQMIAGATQANENYRNKLLTDTRLLSANLGYAGRKYAADLAHPTDAQGNPIEKPPTAYQQSEMDKASATAKNSQINEYNALYSGDPSKNIDGISTVADRINKTIKDGGTVSTDDMRKFGSLYGIYKQKQSAYGNNSINNTDIDQTYNDIKDHLENAQSDLNKKIKSLPKGTNLSSVEDPNAGWWSKMWGNDKVDLATQKKNIDDTIINLGKIHTIGKPQANAGGMPSATGGMAQGTSAQALMQAVQAAKLHPDKIDLIKGRLQGAGIDPSMLDEAMKTQQNQQQSVPQASNMLPAATQFASAEQPEATESEVA